MSRKWTYAELEKELSKPKKLTKVQKYVREIKDKYNTEIPIDNPPIPQLDKAYQKENVRTFLMPEWFTVELFHLTRTITDICKKRNGDLYDLSSQRMQLLFFEITGVIVNGKELMETTLPWEVALSDDNSIAGCPTRDIDPGLLTNLGDKFEHIKVEYISD